MAAREEAAQVVRRHCAAGRSGREGVEEEGVCVVVFLMETRRSWRGSSWGLHVQIQKALREDLCGIALV